MNQENGKGIIFGVLGILTLIIAIMGASLAYFTASAMDADEPITVQAATVTITYLQGDILEASELIPSSYDVVKATYFRTGVDNITQQPLQCKDSKGYEVCSVFRFKASNEIGKNDQRIVGSITTNTDIMTLGQDKEFENLSFTVYRIVDGERILINPNPTTLGKAGDEPSQLFNNGSGETGYNEVEIKAGEIAEFEIVVWLNETGDVQDEQGLGYSGTVKIGISDASDRITGEYSE